MSKYLYLYLYMDKDIVSEKNTEFEVWSKEILLTQICKCWMKRLEWQTLYFNSHFSHLVFLTLFFIHLMPNSISTPCSAKEKKFTWKLFLSWEVIFFSHYTEICEFSSVYLDKDLLREKQVYICQLFEWKEKSRRVIDSSRFVRNEISCGFPSSV